MKVIRKTLLLAVLGAALIVLTMAALALSVRSGDGTAHAQGAITMSIDTETTGNSADTLGTIETCSRVNVPSPAFDDVSDYNVDVYVAGDTQAPIAYDAWVTYDQTKVHIAEPGYDDLIKMPGAMSLSDSRPDSDGQMHSGVIYFDGPGIAGNGTLVRLGLDIGASGVVTFGWAKGAYLSPAGLHTVTTVTAKLAINQDCPPPNRVPTCNDLTLTTDEDTPIEADLGCTDADGDPLTYQIATAPAHGALSGTAPNLTYTPAANYNGADSFAYKANDGELDSNTATASITVTPVNDVPVCNNLNITTPLDTPVAATLVCSDVDGDALTYSVVSPPAHGALAGTAPNLTYTPAAGYSGLDSFTYRANDGNADSEIAVVSITVTTPPARPPNDDFDDATLIPEVPFVDHVDTRGATTAADDPDCSGRGNTVWYSFVAPENMRIEANTFESNYDTTLSVYTGSRGALSQIACNDDTDSLQSFVSFDAVAGEAYSFMIGAYGSRPGGDLTLAVNVAPPPLEISLSIDPAGAVVAKTGVVTIGGIVTCSKAAFVDLHGELRQRAGRLIVRGYFSSSLVCAGQVPWSATVVGDNGLYKAGAADVSVSAVAFVDDEFALTEATATVQLKGSRPPKLCPGGGNDGFEAGIVDTNVIPCWTVVDQSGSWGSWCNQTGTLPPQGACAGSSTSVAAPPEGSQAAMTNQSGPGSHMLYRCGVLRSGPISFELYVNNEYGAFFNPGSLDYGVWPNQQFRADLVTAAGIAADPFTTSPEDVLLNIYQTLPGDPPVSGYTTVIADAGAYVGQPVCLRLAEVENQWFFHAGVDDVNIDLRSKG